jgi:hypothetical protein
MKNPKFKKVIFAAALLISGLITIGSFNVTTTGSKSASSILETPFLKIGSLSGSTEFYFVPAGDGRLWHIVNNYSTLSNGKKSHNTSSYLFSKDSVSVKNDFSVIPEMNLQEILSNSLINLK